MERGRSLLIFKVRGHISRSLDGYLGNFMWFKSNCWFKLKIYMLGVCCYTQCCSCSKLMPSVWQDRQCISFSGEAISDHTSHFHCKELKVTDNHWFSNTFIVYILKSSNNTINHYVGILLICCIIISHVRKNMNIGSPPKFWKQGPFLSGMQLSATCRATCT